MAQKEILVFADWKGLDGPVRIGNLFSSLIKGKEVFSFTYDKKWIGSGRYHLLDPALQLLSGPQYPREPESNFGLFLDSSPDRWGRLLMNRREALEARKEGRKPKTLLDSDYLLGVQDRLRMGGLRFKLNETGPFLNDDRYLVIPPMTRLRELEEASFQLENDNLFDDPAYSAWLNLLLAPGSSLGGARPKASVVDQRQELWIAKFPGRGDIYNTGGWEMVAWELARRCGLTVPEAKCEIYSRHGHTFLTRRFDRTSGGERIHFASAMTLLNYTDGVDVKEGASYFEIAEFIIQNGADVNHDLEELWRRIVFNICIKNTDDHLRNHGFLFTARGWKLSPAYDLNPNPTGRGLTLNISLTDNSADLELAMEVRSFFRLTDQKASEIIEIVKNEVSDWRYIAEKIGIQRYELEMMSKAFNSSYRT